MIQNIAIEKLHECPDNPRRDIGDVTELAESIKASGVLQNLTVVPCTGFYHGEYTVIIGHRRLAAAKLAGLKELPCAIVEMDKKQQVATMLLENMQRSDLTVYEQAQGMQMMLDLGDSINEISEKTGFSESTIRRRVKLLELDADKFKKSEERQVSMSEYDKLFEIKDEDKRNELLEHIGTVNFNNKFIEARNNEEKDKKKAELIAEVEKFATYKSSEDIRPYKYVSCISSIKEIPQERESVPYYYSSAWGMSLYIYRDYTEEEKAQQDEESRQKEENARKQEAESERWQRLEELRERCYQLRFDFIKNCTNLRKKINALCEFAAWSFTFWESINDLEIAELSDADILDDGQDIDTNKFLPYLQENAFNGLLYTAYSHIGDSEEEGYHGWEGEQQSNDNLDILYDFLIALGYELSDEEKAYKDGTHELFVKEDE